MEKFSKLFEQSGKKWKIGLDLHGVISDMPEFFAFFTDVMFQSGAEIHIITGGATEDDKKLLRDYNIKYTHEIDLHIDDTLIYNNFFTTPFARLWSHSHSGKAAHKDPRHLD